MANQIRTAVPQDPLERGLFTDGNTTFKVRASSAVAPDSFQVSADDKGADIVLIVSGLNSGRLHATWGRGWRGLAPGWKERVEDAAFNVFYTGHFIANRPNPDGTVRFCDG